MSRINPATLNRLEEIRLFALDMQKSKKNTMAVEHCQWMLGLVQDLVTDLELAHEDYADLYLKQGEEREFRQALFNYLDNARQDHKLEDLRSRFLPSPPVSTCGCGKEANAVFNGESYCYPCLDATI